MTSRGGGGWEYCSRRQFCQKEWDSFSHVVSPLKIWGLVREGPIWDFKQLPGEIAWGKGICSIHPSTLLHLLLLFSATVVKLPQCRNSSTECHLALKSGTCCWPEWQRIEVYWNAALIYDWFVWFVSDLIVIYTIANGAEHLWGKNFAVESDQTVCRQEKKLWHSGRETVDSINEETYQILMDNKPNYSL